MMGYILTDIAEMAEDKIDWNDSNTVSYLVYNWLHWFFLLIILSSTQLYEARSDDDRLFPKLDICLHVKALWLMHQVCLPKGEE